MGPTEGHGRKAHATTRVGVMRTAALNRCIVEGFLSGWLGMHGSGANS